MPTGNSPDHNAQPLSIEVTDGVSAISHEDWNTLEGAQNPFVSHEFLSLLEESGSVGEGSGWRPVPFGIYDQGKLIAAAPAYLKGHSQGEYVFDHAWADAWQRAGGHYYPKLQIAAPFSPVPGPRLLGGETNDSAQMLLAALAQFTEEHKLSSAHATFIAPEQVKLFEQAGWLIRIGQQFHWQNRDYTSFDDFLDGLSSRKRKNLRKERAAAQQAVSIHHFSGDGIQAEHWDAFWTFYMDTSARKWGTPYLTREAFKLMGEQMADKVLLVMAKRDGLWIAGALNIIGEDRIYGRYWGALMDINCLHFELCYYQAIDAAIERGLKVVEAGAQGSHKLARGYEPTLTYSAHYIPNEGFRAAIADFLERERAAMQREIEFLGEMTPFKKGLVSRAPESRTW